MEKTNGGKYMKFTYTKITGHYFCKASDEWEEDGIEFTYEPTTEQLKSEVKELITRDFGEEAWKMVEELDLVECIAVFYEEELKDIFEQEAMEWYND
jgi:hypothetical protein